MSSGSRLCSIVCGALVGGGMVWDGEIQVQRWEHLLVGKRCADVKHGRNGRCVPDKKLGAIVRS